MAEIDYGYSRQETINVASDFAHHLGLCDESHSLSLQWLYIISSTVGPCGTMSESGWSNTEIFSQYMQEHLIKYLPARIKDSHVLVLSDGHRSLCFCL